MTDKKRIREIIGYTHQKQRADADLWYRNSISFYEAAIVLHEYKERITGGLRIFQYNAALSLELIFKAILAAKGDDIPTIHILRELCVKADVQLNDDQKHTLDLLTENILWLARYPTPKTEGQWDSFHDKIIEKHIVRMKSSNTHTTLANPKRFPSIENYKSIWGICISKYVSIPTNQ